MHRFSFEGKLKKGHNQVTARLLLLYFQDENKVHFIYSPHLDLSGYGNTVEEAKQSFEIAFEDLMDYTISKGTLVSLLEELGWQIKGTKKVPKIVTPDFSDIQQKQYVSEIFDKYPVNTYHQEVPISAFA